MHQQIAWLLIFIGLAIALIGLLWLLIPGVSWLGRLPGDIRIERDGVHVYIPITTSILLSILLTLTLWVFSWLSSSK